MGGHVNYTLACDLECAGPIPLGRGFKAFTATSPSGKTIVIDSVSFGVVGDSIEDVKKDVAAGSLAVMRKQQREAKAHFKSDIQRNAVEVREPGYFWAKLNLL